MNDPVAKWREALKDAQHPRHQAVWLLFSEGADPKSAARLLADHQAEVVPWLLEIVDTPSLYEEGSFRQRPLRLPMRSVSWESGWCWKSYRACYTFWKRKTGNASFTTTR